MESRDTTAKEQQEIGRTSVAKDRNLTIPNEEIQRRVDQEQVEALTSRSAGDQTVSQVGAE